jgi:hypothetical protein
MSQQNVELLASRGYEAPNVGALDTVSEGDDGA